MRNGHLDLGLEQMHSRPTAAVRGGVLFVDMHLVKVCDKLPEPANDAHEQDQAPRCWLVLAARTSDSTALGCLSAG